MGGGAVPGDRGTRARSRRCRQSSQDHVWVRGSVRVDPERLRPSDVMVLEGDLSKIHKVPRSPSNGRSRTASSTGGGASRQPSPRSATGASTAEVTRGAPSGLPSSAGRGLPSSAGRSAPRTSASSHRSHGRWRWCRPRVPIASSSTLAFNPAGGHASRRIGESVGSLKGRTKRGSSISVRSGRQ